jgi:hypothetical protein
LLRDRRLDEKGRLRVPEGQARNLARAILWARTHALVMSIEPRVVK